LIQSKLKFDTKFDTTKAQAKSKFSNTVEIKNQTEEKFDSLTFANFTLGKTELSSTKISLRR